MRRLLGRGVLGVVAALAVAAGLTGCGGPASLTAYADFPDVSDLAVGAPVQMADITIGSVRQITLVATGSGLEARVRMTIERSADVPNQVTAQVQRTTILGERVVSLVPAAGVGSSAPLLADGTDIRDTKVVPDLEQLVKGGTQVFAPISASAFGALVQAGGEGFGDQAASLHRLLGDLDAISSAYAGQSATIRSLIASLDQLSSSTAPDAAASARAVSNLARTTTILAQQSQRFNDLLAALNGLSVQGRSILENYLPQIGVQLTGLADATHAIAAEQDALGQLLVYLKGHNVSVSRAVVGRFVQVLDDIVVCGVPNGGSDNTPAGSCGP
ncbi:MAG TPA: MlaD family protein [Acidimicrobiales bacterium]|nr:MlaD family protein [Acidimicrobiales bacterium]